MDSTPPSPSCPTDDELLRLAGAASPDGDGGLHLEECVRCAERRARLTLGGEERTGEIESLKRRLDRGLPSVVRATDVLVRACAWLHAAHARGEVHGGLRPEHVLLGEGGTIRLVGFGATPGAGAAAPSVGAPAYRAPELNEGGAPTTATDVYGLGELALALFTGRTRSAGDQAEALDHLPGSYRRIVEACLALDPADRPAGVDEVASELRRALARYEHRRPEADLPPTAGAFVGRAADVETAETWLRGSARLVTLHGPAGSGRTRLAIEIARRADERADTAYPPVFCSLDGAATRFDVCGALAAGLEVPLVGEDALDPVRHLGRALRDRGAVLVVLDGFEPVRAHATTTLGRWLERSPEARFLVTARSPLGLEAERALEIGGLGGSARPLLVDRLAITAPELHPDDAGLDALLRAVDGSPLSIELVAGQLAARAPREVAAALVEHLDGREPSAREVTRFVWSGLEEVDRGVLGQCAVFAGTFTLEAAEAVLVTPEDAPALEEVLRSLLERSLLTVAPSRGAGPLRLSVHPVVRARAVESLDETTLTVARARHAAYFLRRAERLATGLGGLDGVEALAELSADAIELSAVLERAQAAGSSERALRAALALSPALSRCGPSRAHLVVLDAVIADAGGLREAALRAALARSGVHLRHGHLREARRDAEEVVARAAEAGFDELSVLASARLCEVQRAAGALQMGAKHATSALRLAEREHPHLRGRVTLELGRVEIALGSTRRGASLLRAALDSAEGSGDATLEAEALEELAAVDVGAGDLGSAIDRLERALALREALTDTTQLGRVLCRLGEAQRCAGSLSRARACFERGLSILRSVGAARAVAAEGEALASLCLDLGELDTAEQLLDRAGTFALELGDGALGARARLREAVLAQERGRSLAAHARLRSAVRALTDGGGARHEAEARGVWAGLLHEEGRLEEALAQIDPAVASAEELEDDRLVALLAGVRAGIHGERGALDEARADWARASARAGRDPAVDAAVSVQAGFLEVAEALRARAAGDAAAAARLFRAAQRRAESTVGPPSERARFARRCLRRALERVGALAGYSGPVIG